MARGVSSSEVGLGSSAIAHSTADTEDPTRQGLIGMLGPFIDTIVVSTMTALVLLTTDAWQSGVTKSLQGIALSTYAFEQGLSGLGIGHIGGAVIVISLIFFGFTTLVTWSYYGDRCAHYLLGDKGSICYRLFFLCMTVMGAVMPLQVVWGLTDTANFFMLVPNVISLLLLSGLASQLVKKNFSAAKRPYRLVVESPLSLQNER